MRWNWKVEVIKALVYMLSQEIIIKKVKKKKYHKDCAEKPKNGTSYLTRIGDQLLQCLHPLVYFISPFLKHIKFS